MFNDLTDEETNNFLNNLNKYHEKIEEEKKRRTEQVYINLFEKILLKGTTSDKKTILFLKQQVYPIYKDLVKNNTSFSKNKKIEKIYNP